jgi:hypothetical protein
MTYTTKTIIINGQPVQVKVYPAHVKTPRASKKTMDEVEPEHLPPSIQKLIGYLPPNK